MVVGGKGWGSFLPFYSNGSYMGVTRDVLTPDCLVTWLILPVAYAYFIDLSHACLSIGDSIAETA